MRVLLTGSSGLVGSALTPVLAANGHEVIKLVRSSSRAVESEGLATWNPEAGGVDLERAGTLDAVVHLAGESIAQRWTPEVKRRIRDSRVQGTRVLSDALTKLSTPPKVLVCASATGFYGNRGAEWLDERSAPGQGFLAETCQQWEASADSARERGIRVAHLRIGIVLASQGGALRKMLPAFRLGLGGKLGDGRAYWSWIALDDLLEAILRALSDESLQGPMNVVSPGPATNAAFTATLGRVLRRPTIFSVPRFAVEMLFGEMGREALLSSVRVRPAKLLEAGFRFRFAELETALRHLLGATR
jgi:uncharacterized protein (TIGR01777 family)